MSFGLYVISVAAEAPPIDTLQPVRQGENSVVYAADGSRLGYIQSDEARTSVTIDKIPEELQDATVAIEDERFYDHNGVDLEGVARAAVENIEAGEVKQGGSTITMQLVRNLYIDDPERDLERKIKEAKLAEELEDELSKEEILEQYLNSASYGTVNGRTAVGVEAAAQIYYSKPANDLTLAESAMLAGLPQSPSLYNPLQNPTSALERRNEVLDEMAKQGYIRRVRGRGRHGRADQPQPRQPLQRDPRALLLRLRRAAADRGVRGQHRPPGRPAGPHDDRPRAAGGRARGDRRQPRLPERPLLRGRRDRPRQRASSGRWPRAAATPTPSSTSPPRATASPARPSRPGR